MKVLGIMSGTSLDGIDFCYLDICRNTSSYNYTIINATTYSYSKEWKEVLQTAFSKLKEEVYEINKKYTIYINELIHQFIDTYGIVDLDLIGSHGHTIWHQPNDGFTLQIGNLQGIKKGLSCPVICDFRVQDVLLGGQGAPLVPIGDQFLFADFTYCLNLGGFSNVSYQSNGMRVAFDICPINVLLNHYTNQFYHIPFDDCGVRASKGNVFSELFEKLNSIPYYNKSFPKSLGIENTNKDFIPLIDSYELPAEDVLATLVEHMAYQISNVMTRSKGKLLITGGGAYNLHLINRIKYYCKEIEIVIPDQYTVEYKEALIFGLLAYLKYYGENNVLSSVTGAKRDHSSGLVYV